MKSAAIFTIGVLIVSCITLIQCCDNSNAASSRYSMVDIYDYTISGRDTDSDGKKDQAKVDVEIDSSWWLDEDVTIDVYLFPPDVTPSNSSNEHIDLNSTTYNPDDVYPEEFTFYG